MATWGGETQPPDGAFHQVAAGAYDSCGMQVDGTAAGRGQGIAGDIPPPPAGTFQEVTAGGIYACGLRIDGSIACWGHDEEGQSDPPGAAP